MSSGIYYVQYWRMDDPGKINEKAFPNSESATKFLEVILNVSALDGCIVTEEDKKLLDLDD